MSNQLANIAKERNNWKIEEKKEKDSGIIKKCVFRQSYWFPLEANYDSHINDIQLPAWLIEPVEHVSSVHYQNWIEIEVAQLINFQF